MRSSPTDCVGLWNSPWHGLHEAALHLGQLWAAHDKGRSLCVEQQIAAHLYCIVEQQAAHVWGFEALVGFIAHVMGCFSIKQPLGQWPPHCPCVGHWSPCGLHSPWKAWGATKRPLPLWGIGAWAALCSLCCTYSWVFLIETPIWWKNEIYSSRRSLVS